LDALKARGRQGWAPNESVTRVLTHAADVVNDRWPIPTLAGGSLAHRIRRFYAEIDGDDHETLDAMYAYRQSHGLRFALRGFDIGEIYLGRVEEAVEISCDSGDEKWAYTIDFQQFVEDVRAVAQSCERVTES